MQTLLTVLSLSLSLIAAQAKPVDLPPTKILPDDRESVKETVATIQQNFKRAFGIRVQVSPRLIQVDNEEEPVGEYSFHEIKFGRLSRAEFEKLEAYYAFPLRGAELAPLTYDDKRSYRLLDFLAPKIQPLPGKTFYAGLPRKLVDPSAKGKKRVYFGSNCWTTVYDVLRSDVAPWQVHGFVFDEVGGGQLVYQTIMNPAYTEELTPAQAGERAYDVFVHTDQIPGEAPTFMHTGLFVGPGLIFEKVGLATDRFRIGAYEKNEESPIPVHFRRLKATLPHPETVAGDDPVGNQKIYLKHPGTVIRLPDGTYGFDPANPVNRTFRDSLLRICSREDAERKLCNNWPHESGRAVDLD